MAGTKDRIVKMEVLALGMPRTGTASMQAALRILGYSDVSHGFDLVYQPISSNAWEVAVDAKFYGKGPPCSREIFDAILGRCAAATDVPSSFFAEELLAAYPDVKVILVERDFDKWLKSFRTLMDGVYGWRGSVIQFIDQFLGYAGLRTVRKLYAGKFRIREKETIDNARIKEAILVNASVVYEDHYDTIRRIVPKDKLLNYELGSGWDQICEFLGKEKPQEKFPRINEAAALEKAMNGVVLDRLREISVKLLWPTGLLVLLLAAGVAVKR